MAVTTLGRETVKAVLPEKYKSWLDQPLTKSRLQKLTTELAKEDPDKYIDILQNLNAIGQSVVSVYGKDTTITLDDIDSGASVKNIRKKLQQLINNVVNDPKLSPQQKQDKIIQLGYKYTGKMRELGVQDARQRKTGIANQIASGSRGNPVQLMQLIIGDMMMKDAMNRDIPYLANMPYVDGDSPLSYWASAMSGRKSTYDVQAATGKVGYLSKQGTNVTHNTPIAIRDCGTKNTGIPVKADDPENVGAILLRDWGNYKAGTPITEQMLKNADPDEEIIVRSPTTCKAHNGVCALCAGIQQNGKLPPIGSYVALNATKTFMEPLTQAGISCLHPGTKVRMADWSIKSIKDIKVGDMVIGSDTQGNCRPVKVNHVFHNGIQPVWKSTLSISKCNQVQILSTLEHKFLVKCDKNPIQLLPLKTKAKNKYLGLARSIQTIQQPIHEPMAFLLGLLCGDGCYSKGVKGQVHLSCADPILVDYLHEYLKSFDMHLHLCAGQSIYYSISKNKRSSQQSPIKKKLIAYGMMDKYSYQKTMPNNFRNWDQWSIKQFISGLVTADGHIGQHRNRPRFNIGSTSKQLLEQVAQVFQRYIALPKLHISSNRYEGKQTLHLLQVSSKYKIAQLLNWIQPRGIKEVAKQNILKSIGQKDPQLLIPNIRQEVAKLLSQQFLGDMQTIDIQVDHPDHLFLLANGIICGNSKHGSGIGGKKVVDPEGEDQPQGFDSIQRMLLAPSNFPGGAVLSKVDGRVTEIRKAPQGGHFITVGNTSVYSPSARTVTAKVGDQVQAGDMLTNGVPNPMQIVKYKGIGQGRQYFTKKLFDLLPKAGAGTARRNIQQFSRAMINKVRITDDNGYGGYYPGQIADYDQLADKWVPRDDSKQLSLKDSKGKYLQQPVLYFSIGTRITPHVINKLQKSGYDKVVTNDNPPPWQPQFVTSRNFMLTDKNWMPRLNGQRLSSALFDAARTGITDPYDSPSFVDKMVIAPYDPSKTTRK